MTAGSCAMTEMGTLWLALPAHGHRRLVVAEDDEHEVRASIVLDEREERAQRVLDRVAVPLSASLAPAMSTGRCLKIEPLPTRFQPISGGTCVHGSSVETRSTSAKSGGRPVFPSSWRWRASHTYWSGIDAYA